MQLKEFSVLLVHLTPFFYSVATDCSNITFVVPQLSIIRTTVREFVTSGSEIAAVAWLHVILREDALSHSLVTYHSVRGLIRDPGMFEDHVRDPEMLRSLALTSGREINIAFIKLNVIYFIKLY